MTTIKEIFGNKEVVAQDLKSATNLNPPDPKLIYGLELEIECANPEWGEIAGWNSTEDGSLRNDGWEFISSPATFNTVAHRLNKFFDNAKSSGFNPERYPHYTERTSTHVHTNCQDLTLEELSSILLLYQVTEDLLYEFVGQDRINNIFCVPWSQTQITFETVTNLKYFITTINIDRNKYTGLNLVPLQTLGTIEWRHMPGHADQEKILNWLRIIGHYYRVARSVPFEEIKEKLINLNSNSQYDWLLDWLFQDMSPIIRTPLYRQMLENGVLNMKYSILSPRKKGIQYSKEFIDAYITELRNREILQRTI